MDEQTFWELQKENCWFTFPFLDNAPEIDSSKTEQGEAIFVNDVYKMRYIFAITFGAFGHSVNREMATTICRRRLALHFMNEPENKDLDDPEYAEWFNRYAQYNILLGTILVYRYRYPLAAYYLMRGLKTNAVNLFMPYCDFIRHVLSKVEAMPADYADYEGRGFSVDEPMGSVSLNGGALIASAAELIIPALEGDGGEIILVHQGRNRYGTLRRCGSTMSENFRNCIDIYEALMFSGGKLKKLRLYFNGYFSPESRCDIRLPKGFHLAPNSRAAQIFKVVD